MRKDTYGANYLLGVNSNSNQSKLTIMYTKYNVIKSGILAATLLSWLPVIRRKTSMSSPKVENASHPITSDTLTGSVTGTLLSGRTYYFSSDITINANDTC